MAGQTIWRVNARHISYIANDSQTQQQAFKVLFDFFEQMVAAGYATRIALNFGLGGTGTDYWYEANPFGENAFAVFRMNGSGSGNADSRRDGVDLADFDYYVLIQWADSSLFGAAPGNPGLTNGSTSDGSGIAVAVREDNGNPWAGTTNNDGTDSKGTPVWTGGASTVHVFPISNSYTGGSHLANKENTCRLWDQYLGICRFHFIGNADSFVLIRETAYNSYAKFFGVYSPRAGLNPAIPLACVSEYTSLPWADGPSTTWGDTAGSSNNQGGVLGEDLSSLMSPLCVGQKVSMVYDTDRSYMPNCQFDPPRYDLYPIRVAQLGAGRVGYVGNLDPSLIRASYGWQYDLTHAQDWAFFGQATNQYGPRLAVRWDPSLGRIGSARGMEGTQG